MSVALVVTGFSWPKLTHFPTSISTKVKPLRLNPNPFTTKFTHSSSKFPGRGRILFSSLHTVVAGGQDDDMSDSQSNGVLEQEDRNPFFPGSSRFLSPIVGNGLQSTVNRLSKWLVAALFTVTILWRHDAEALWAAMGSVLNSALSVVLKKILNQERPNSAISAGPGMPSSHAQSIFYAAIFLTWSLLEWLGVNYLSLVLSTLVLTGGSYLSWLRVSQQYHTVSQVAVGAAVGSAFAFLWLWSWQAVVSHWFAASLWVRLVVIVGSVIFCLCFLLHVIRDWLKTEQ